MNATIYFSVSKERNSEIIAKSLEGDIYQIKPKGRIWKSTFMQMFMYGYKTTANKKVEFVVDDIDFSKYDLITLVSPVWAGRVCQYMRKYLETVPFKNKNVVLVGTSKGGYSKYFSSYKDILDSSNKIINEIMYVDGKKVN